jgi:hypothetical protein
MFFRSLRLPIFFASIALALLATIQLYSTVYASYFYTPKLNHCVCLHNATQQKSTTAWGVRGYVTWTNPALNSGWVSYHRVGIVKDGSPFKFAEYGTGKYSDGIKSVVAYDAGSGPVNKFFAISAATHRYTVTYSASSGNYNFYVDGSFVYGQAVGFSSANSVVGGGEVGNGVEAMNSTQLYTLEYQATSSGGYQAWNGYSVQRQDAPYYNGYVNNNSFTNKP